MKKAKPTTTRPVLVRRVLREEIRELLIKDILAGRLPPGSRIVETRLAKEFGVSQAPVREALRDLELLGFIVSSAYRGSQVRRISHDEMKQIYPIRGVLEGLAARLAATRVAEKDLKHMEDLLAKMHASAQRGDVQAEVEADIAFHRFIIEASGNHALLQFWETMRLATTTFLTFSASHRPLDELAERHRPIVDALRSHDPVAAEAAMRSHIEELADWTLEADLRRSHEKSGSA